MQSSFLDWLFYNHRNIFHVTYAASNEGQRTKKTAFFAKKRGMKPGVPDLCIPISRGESNALYLELKIKPNKPTPNQIRMMSLLSLHGNYCVVCYSLEACIKVFEDYLEGKCLITVSSES